MESLNRIVEETDPSVIALVETKLAENEDINIQGYQTWKMNRDEHGGGIMFLAKEELQNITIVVEKKNDVGEVMWVTIANGRTNIRFGIVYAPQENKTSIVKLKEMYKGISKQINEAKDKNQNVLLVGDFNCKIGKDIKDNTDEVSKGGKLLLKMTKKMNMKIMNTSDTCQGVWTRVEGEKKSVLDYVIMNRADEDLVKTMYIDEDREITPKHEDDEGRTIFTDHNTIKVEVNWNMNYTKKGTERVLINEKTKKEFEEKTNTTSLTEIWNTTKEMKEKYSEWSKQVTDLAEKTFTTKTKKKTESKAIRMLKKRKKEIKKKFHHGTDTQKKIYLERRKLIEQHMENHAREKNTKQMITAANQIKSEKGFDGSAFWEFKRRTQGKKKETMESIKNEKGEIEEDPEKILEIYKNFYKKLLTGREMDTTAGKEAEQLVNKYIEELEKKAYREGIKPFTEEEYQKVKKELKNRKSQDLQGWRYEFIKNAGKDLDESILKMVNELAACFLVPEEWEEMVVKSISKGKGDLKAMISKRGLFLTNIASKLMEKMIKNRWKKTVELGMTAFQCGGVNLRGIGDNLLIVNSTIEEYRAENKNLYILFADLEKCFDKLWLKDCIKELAEAGMPAAEAIYIYKMNQRVRAVVETPIGKTEMFELEQIVRQGTVSAVDLCAVSTDKINKLPRWEPTLMVSGIEIKHPVYVDDMIGLGTTEMVEGLEPKMKFLEETKKYTFNNEEGKTEIMEMKLGKETTPPAKPVVCVNRGEIGYTKKYKCLGDQYDETGKNMSKIEKKMEKRKFIAAEVKRYGSYSQVGKADVSVRMLMMEALVKPTLLFNTETWIDITDGEMKKINQGHYEVLRKVFEQKESTPYYGILSETGYWPYSYVIIYKRLMYFHHLIHSDERRITRKMIINQKMGIGKGKTWYGGVEEWLTKLEMERSVEKIIQIKKSTWKKELKEKIEDVVAAEINEQGKKMTKLRFTNEFGKKNYLEEERMEKVKEIMKLRLNMIDLKANFKGKYTDTTCPACEEDVETTEHVIQCNEYRRIIGHSIVITESIEHSMKDTKWLVEASKVYQQIEEIRKWLVD